LGMVELRDQAASAGMLTIQSSLSVAMVAGSYRCALHRPCRRRAQPDVLKGVGVRFLDVLGLKVFLLLPGASSRG
jgi:hypothetical protein